VTFPSLASLDVLLVPALADAGETAAIYRDADGIETPITAWVVDMPLVQYETGGVIVNSLRREIEIQRSQVRVPVGGSVVIVNGATEQLMERVGGDSAMTRWAVVQLRANGT